MLPSLISSAAAAGKGSASVAAPAEDQPSCSPHAALFPLDERTIADGDLVIVYENPSSMKAVTVSSTGRFDNRFGSFQHKDWIGRRFGSKVVAKNGKGWCFLLAPTPELWTLVLKHRTQILYIADISVICMQLELRPGLTVLESGTGSASLTHSLARAVAPGGHVYTYEFHPERAEEAKKELVAHGLGPVVTVTQRDIMENGFPLERHDGCVDAVFLDLPGPWKVVANAAQCLRPNGRFCSFSPCIEQVQRTCEALRENGCTDIQTLEVLLREHEVRSERLQLCGAAEAGAPGPKGAAANGGAPAAAAQGAGPEAAADPQTSPAAKRQKKDSQQSSGAGATHMVTSRPHVEARGHTGYLTFARKFV